MRRARAVAAAALALATILCLPVTALGLERIVDPNHPGARDAGAGEAAHPYVSIGYALGQMRVGDRLTIRAGIYRETLELDAIAGIERGDAQTVVEGAPGEQVEVRGSDAVQGWERVREQLFVKRGVAVEPQQVFVDGQRLQQIGGRIFGGFPERHDTALEGLHASEGGIWPGRRAPTGDLPPDSFFFDASHGALYVRVARASLEGAMVEVAMRPYAIHGVHIRAVQLRNLRIAHSNTSTFSRHGAVHLNGDQIRLEQIHVADCDLIGIVLHGADNEMMDSSANDCGQLGMHLRGRRLRMTNNETNGNNTRGFNKWWEAGGIKIIGEGGLRDAEIDRHRAIANHGDGIWIDWGNDAITVRRSTLAYNGGFGLHYEASTGGQIYDNHVFGNRARGIYVFQSSDCIVARNLVFANQLDGIAVMDDARRDPQGALDLNPRRNLVFGNVLAWNDGAAIVFPKLPRDNRSDGNLIVSERGTRFSIGWPSLMAPRDLPSWRSKSGQDGGSREVRRTMPRAWADALRARALTFDWSELQELAATQPLPPVRARKTPMELAGSPGPLTWTR